jgi:hypothetical protein
MQYDLLDALGTLGRLDLMEAINARLRSYHEAYPLEPGDKAAHDAAQREFSVALNQRGDILSDQGDLACALKSYRDGLGIAEKLVKQAPGNVGWQRDLSVSYERVGLLKERTGLTADQQGWPDSIEADLRKMQEKK